MGAQPTRGVPGTRPAGRPLPARALPLATCCALLGTSEAPPWSATLLLSCLAVWNTGGSVEGRLPAPFNETATTAMLSVEPASYAACRTALASACSLAEVLQAPWQVGWCPFAAELSMAVADGAAAEQVARLGSVEGPSAIAGAAETGGFQMLPAACVDAESEVSPVLNSALRLVIGGAAKGQGVRHMTAKLCLPSPSDKLVAVCACHLCEHMKLCTPATKYAHLIQQPVLPGTAPQV